MYNNQNGQNNQNTQNMPGAQGNASGSSGSNHTVVPEAKQALNNMKYEIANELA